MSLENNLEFLTLFLAPCLAFSFVIVKQGLNLNVAQAGPELMTILLPQSMSQSLHAKLGLKAPPWGHLWLEGTWTPCPPAPDSQGIRGSHGSTEDSG